MPLLTSGLVMELYARYGQGDMVIPTFIRIMQSLASLKTDEKSQARAMFLTAGGEDIDWLFLMFERAYCMANKSLNFEYDARILLEDLLKGVNIKAQRAWYHIQLMSLNLKIGDANSAKKHAEEVISITDGMGRPDYMVRFLPAYLLLDKIDIANNMVYKVLIASPRGGANYFLAGIEPFYHELGCITAFNQLCDRFESEYVEELKELGINQIRLKSADYSSKMDSQECFNVSQYLSNCKWIDPEGMSSYSLQYETGHIEINATNGSMLGHGRYSAPRFSQSFTGDFTIEARMGGARSGGLFIQDDNDIIAIHRWLSRYNPIVFVHGRNIVGRGYLDSESLVFALERKDNIIGAYCSPDGQNWYSCGWTETDMADSVETGIFASCLNEWGEMEQAVTSFDHIRVYSISK